MFLLQKQSEDLGDHTSSKTQIFCPLFLGHSSWQIKVIQSNNRYQLAALPDLLRVQMCRDRLLFTGKVKNAPKSLSN